MNRLLKLQFSILFLLVTYLIELHAQETNSIRIFGDVVSEKSFSIDQFKSFESSDLGELDITNHAGEARGILKELKGFPVLKLLEQVSLNTPSPKQLSEFYFVFEASDGYKVVFSWNELFNNPLGKDVYLITSANGKTQEEMEDRILLVVKSDIRTGRRHLKNLAQIHVIRAD